MVGKMSLISEIIVLFSRAMMAVNLRWRFSCPKYLKMDQWTRMWGLQIQDKIVVVFR